MSASEPVTVINNGTVKSKPIGDIKLGWLVSRAIANLNNMRDRNRVKERVKELLKPLIQVIQFAIANGSQALRDNQDATRKIDTETLGKILEIGEHMRTLRVSHGIRDPGMIVWVVRLNAGYVEHLNAYQKALASGDEADHQKLEKLRLAEERSFEKEAKKKWACIERELLISQLTLFYEGNAVFHTAAVCSYASKEFVFLNAMPIKYFSSKLAKKLSPIMNASDSVLRSFDITVVSSFSSPEEEAKEKDSAISMCRHAIASGLLNRWRRAVPFLNAAMGTCKEALICVITWKNSVKLSAPPVVNFFTASDLNAHCKTYKERIEFNKNIISFPAVAATIASLEEEINKTEKSIGNDDDDDAAAAAAAELLSNIAIVEGGGNVSSLSERVRINLENEGRLALLRQRIKNGTESIKMLQDALGPVERMVNTMKKAGRDGHFQKEEDIFIVVQDRLPCVPIIFSVRLNVPVVAVDGGDGDGLRDFAAILESRFEAFQNETAQILNQAELPTSS